VPVPRGVRSGESFDFTSDGEQYRAQVPSGYETGDILQVEVPAPLGRDAVPSGSVAGNQLSSKPAQSVTSYTTGKAHADMSTFFNSLPGQQASSEHSEAAKPEVRLPHLVGSHADRLQELTEQLSHFKKELWAKEHPQQAAAQSASTAVHAAVQAADTPHDEAGETHMFESFNEQQEQLAQTKRDTARKRQQQQQELRSKARARDKARLQAQVAALETKLKWQLASKDAREALRAASSSEDDATRRRREAASLADASDADAQGAADEDLQTHPGEEVYEHEIDKAEEAVKESEDNESQQLTRQEQRAQKRSAVPPATDTGDARAQERARLEKQVKGLEARLRRQQEKAAEERKVKELERKLDKEREERQVRQLQETLARKERKAVQAARVKALERQLHTTERKAAREERQVIQERASKEQRAREKQRLENQVASLEKKLARQQAQAQRDMARRSDGDAEASKAAEEHTPRTGDGDIFGQASWAAKARTSGGGGISSSQEQQAHSKEPYLYKVAMEQEHKEKEEEAAAAAAAAAARKAKASKQQRAVDEKEIAQLQKTLEDKERALAAKQQGDGHRGTAAHHLDKYANKVRADSPPAYDVWRAAAAHPAARCPPGGVGGCRALGLLLALPRLLRRRVRAYTAEATWAYKAAGVETSDCTALACSHRPAVLMLAVRTEVAARPTG